jgi:hypothetical protein
MGKEMGVQHADGHGHGHAASRRTYNMDMDMKHGYGHAPWTWRWTSILGTGMPIKSLVRHRQFSVSLQHCLLLFSGVGLLFVSSLLRCHS